MDIRKAYSAEGACVIGGLFFVAMAFAADLAQHLTPAGGDLGHGQGGGDIFLRVNLPVMGIACIAFGMGMHILNEHRDRVHFLAYVTGLLILTDGIAHLFATSDHIEFPLYVALFAAVAAVQVAGGVLFPLLPRSWDRYWIAFAVALIAVYAASRSFALPPLWQLEEVEPLGVFSKAVEIFTLFPLIELARARRALPLSASPSGAAEP